MTWLVHATSISENHSLRVNLLPIGFMRCFAIHSRCCCPHYLCCFMFLLLNLALVGLALVVLQGSYVATGRCRERMASTILNGEWRTVGRKWARVLPGSYLSCLKQQQQQ